MANTSRRQFLKTMAGAGYIALFKGNIGKLNAALSPQKQPNILWISTEDINPDLGCYGDKYAISPNVDRFATESTRYTNAFTHAGVCAPVRSGIITGMYPSSIGTCPMRCKGVPQPEVKCFTEYLRAAGYYCSNRSKTDYQFNKPLTAWDDCSKKGHWRNRPAGKPFFSVINLTITHESKIRSPKGKKAEIHDPAKAVVPPYYPDTPLVRNDLACYADNITRMDKMVADILQQLEDDGLAEDTIVWFWGDHGRGLPRCKRWVYDSGMRIPLIIRIPEKFRRWAHPDNPEAAKPGTVIDRMVSSVDFAATMLSLAGIPIPSYMQGRPFLGPQNSKPRRYVYGVRDRIDEAFDLVRSVHDQRYVYLRNFMPYVPYSVHIAYMDQMPTMQEMRRLHAEGKLKGAQKQYFQYPRHVEELYDITQDPYEVHNLAADPQHQDVLLRMRKELLRWMKETRDIGLIPEPDFDMIKRPGDKYELTHEPVIVLLGRFRQNQPVRVKLDCPTPGASIAYQVIKSGNRKYKREWLLFAQPIIVRPGETLRAKAVRLGFDDSKIINFKVGQKPVTVIEYPHQRPHWSTQVDSAMLDRLLAIKNYDINKDGAIPAYLKALDDIYGPVRYWAVLGLHHTCQNSRDKKQAAQKIEMLLYDSSPSTCVAAAHALSDWGETDKALPVLAQLLNHDVGSVRHFAMTALLHLGEKARPLLPVIKSKLKDKNDYVVRTTLHVLDGLQVKAKT